MNLNQPQISREELLILIRGHHRTGKTSLLNLMTGHEPTTSPSSYVPTALTGTSTMRWAPPSSPESKVTITLMDVVSMNPNVSNTTHGAPSGIIVMYDPRDQETVSYAASVIEETKPTVPIAILTNFQDVITASMHPLLTGYKRRCFGIETSMVTNLGLGELNRWLELPWRLGIRNAYQNLISYVTKEILCLNHIFLPGVNKRLKSVDKKEKNSRSGKSVGDGLVSNENDGFWSDDDGNDTRYDDNYEISLYPKEEKNDNDKVEKEDILMDEILKATSKNKIEKTVPKSEIDFNQIKKLPPPKTITHENRTSNKRRHHKSRSHQRNQPSVNLNVKENQNQNDSYLGYDSL